MLKNERTKKFREQMAIVTSCVDAAGKLTGDGRTRIIFETDENRPKKASISRAVQLSWYNAGNFKSRG